MRRLPSRARVAGSRAALRLQRTRTLMTALFALTTALCLAALAVLAAHIDLSSRLDQLRSSVEQRAGGLARAAYIDDGLLHLEPLGEDELARGATVVTVYRLGGSGDIDEVFSSGDAGRTLNPSQRAEVVAEVIDSAGLVSPTVPAVDAAPALVWGAAPIWDGDAIGAVVVAGESTTAATTTHEQLVVGLVSGGAILLAIATAAGYLLSTLAMRPAARSLAQQEQFLSEAAHELRTPLSTLRLRIEQRAEPGTTGELETLDRLDRLLTGLLTRARIDAGTFEPERVALRIDQLVEGVVADDASRVVLRASPTIWVGDPVLLEQAVRNLIENALRHAPGPVSVSVADGALVVADQGRGISPAERSRAVSRGFSSSDGTGSGLSIVSWVVALHAGTLALSDTPGGGLTVTVRLEADTGAHS